MLQHSVSHTGHIVARITDTGLSTAPGGSSKRMGPRWFSSSGDRSGDGWGGSDSCWRSSEMASTRIPSNGFKGSRSCLSDLQ